MQKIIFIYFLIGLVVSYSCTSKEEKEIEDRNAYIQENNITVAPTASGLYYIETVEGNGEQAKANDIVSVHYTGKFLNGKTFDSSYDRNQPIEFTLGIGEVIKGWDEGIALMKEGGEATLIIPSNLAYGAYGTSDGSIPPYSTLVFDVKLIEIK